MVVYRLLGVCFVLGFVCEATSACDDGRSGSDNDGGTSAGSDAANPPDNANGGKGGASAGGAIRVIASIDGQSDAYDLEFSGGDHLLQAKDGTLYATINDAVIASGSSGAATVFHPFGGNTIPNPDGKSPTSLVLTEDGDFYGTTYTGGAYDKGTVFKITGTGNATVLYSFGGSPDDTESLPTSLIQARDGNFYGTTALSGTPGSGTGGEVFQITPDGVRTVVHALKDTVEGAEPRGLMQASDGNFYGVSWGGGAKNAGTVFKVTAAGDASTLVAFEPNQARTQEGPILLIEASDGNLYGVTISGGSSNDGTLFKLTPSGDYTVVHEFNHAEHLYAPNSLVQASDGSFYGGAFTDVHPGAPTGAVFKVTPAGATTLYAVAPGEVSPTSMALGNDGKIYGTDFLALPGAITSRIFEVD